MTDKPGKGGGQPVIGDSSVDDFVSSAVVVVIGWREKRMVR